MLQANFVDVWAYGASIYAASQNAVTLYNGASWSRPVVRPNSQYQSFAAISGDFDYYGDLYVNVGGYLATFQRSKNGVWESENSPGLSARDIVTSGWTAYVVGYETASGCPGCPRYTVLGNGTTHTVVELPSQALSIWRVSGGQVTLGGVGLGYMSGNTYVPLPWSGAMIVDGAGFGSGSVVVSESATTGLYTISRLASTGAIEENICVSCALSKVSVFGSSIFAVGPNGDALWIKGGQRVSARIPMGARSVSASGECNAYAVGDNGLVLKF